MCNLKKINKQANKTETYRYKNKLMIAKSEGAWLGEKNEKIKKHKLPVIK